MGLLHQAKTGALNYVRSVRTAPGGNVSTTGHAGRGVRMSAQAGTATWDVHEPGFDGELRIEGGMVHLLGVRPQDDSDVVKDVPADRDPELAELVRQALAGEGHVTPRLLAHLGVLDPT